MGGCQNDGPFLGTLNIRCRIIIVTQKGTIILTTTHIYIYVYIYIYMSAQAQGGVRQLFHRRLCWGYAIFTLGIAHSGEPLRFIPAPEYLGNRYLCLQRVSGE